ncbi:MAG: hypothetical protein ACLR6B_03955 [Blautia sp.]
MNVTDLQDALVAAMSRFSMTTIVNITTDFIQDNVSMISNYHNIEQDKMLNVFVAISTAMYACSDKSDEFCLSIVDTGADPAKSAVTDDKEEEKPADEEDSIENLIQDSPEITVDDLFSDDELDDDAYDNAIQSELQKRTLRNQLSMLFRKR